MTIPGDELEWQLRYGRFDSARYAAASVVEGVAYLCGSNITTKEAIRRLRLMRRVVNP